MRVRIRRLFCGVMTMMLLDPNDEDGVCGAAYQEWRDETWAFEPDYNPDAYMEYDDEQDNEWECE